MRRNFGGGGAPWQSGGGLVYLVRFLLALATERRYCHWRIFSVPKRSKTGTALLQDSFILCFLLTMAIKNICLINMFIQCPFLLISVGEIRVCVDVVYVGKSIIPNVTKIIFSVLSVLFILWLGAYTIRIHTLNFNVSCALCSNITYKSPFSIGSS